MSSRRLTLIDGEQWEITYEDPNIKKARCAQNSLGRERSGPPRSCYRWPMVRKTNWSRQLPHSGTPLDGSPMVNRCVMPIFYLAPREGQSNDPRWAATSLREGCWVAARSGYAARLKVGMATLKEECWIVAPRRRMSRDQEKRYSPWLNAHLTECRPDNPPIDVPEGIILTVSGKTIS